MCWQISPRILTNVSNLILGDSPLFPIHSRASLRSTIWNYSGRRRLRRKLSVGLRLAWSNLRMRMLPRKVPKKWAKRSCIWGPTPWISNLAINSLSWSSSLPSKLVMLIRWLNKTITPKTASNSVRTSWLKYGKSNNLKQIGYLSMASSNLTVKSKLIS